MAPEAFRRPDVLPGLGSRQHPWEYRIFVTSFVMQLFLSNHLSNKIFTECSLFSSYRSRASSELKFCQSAPSSPRHSRVIGFIYVYFHPINSNVKPKARVSEGSTEYSHDLYNTVVDNSKAP